MQYLPVAFAVFQVFLPTGLVIYYFTQAVVRIVQQWYITKRFYGHDGSIGRQAQAASKEASDMAKDAKGKAGKALKPDKVEKPAPMQSKRVTPPKNRPAPSGRPQRPIPPSKRKK
jgi:YidC/Oxa1 family membrane protein insertase